MAVCVNGLFHVFRQYDFIKCFKKLFERNYNLQSISSFKTLELLFVFSIPKLLFVPADGVNWQN